MFISAVIPVHPFIISPPLFLLIFPVNLTFFFLLSLRSYFALLFFPGF
jgi:hypothetical protein